MHRAQPYTAGVYTCARARIWTTIREYTSNVGPDATLNQPFVVPVTCFHTDPFSVYLTDVITTRSRRTLFHISSVYHEPGKLPRIYVGSCFHRRQKKKESSRDSRGHGRPASCSLTYRTSLFFRLLLCHLREYFVYGFLLSEEDRQRTGILSFEVTESLFGDAPLGLFSCVIGELERCMRAACDRSVGKTPMGLPRVSIKR